MAADHSEMLDQTTPAESAIKRAISVLNMEAGRLRMKADYWTRTGSPNDQGIQDMQDDAAELDAVRAYLEQFVTRA